MITITDEFERVGVVDGVDELRVRSTKVGGLVLTLEDRTAVNLEGQFVLELEDGREVTIDAHIESEGPERPVLFTGLSEVTRPRPKR